jgi:Ca2+-binding RTX toxin-like protein
MALKDTGFGELIPKAEVVIFDEAHQIPDIASEYFGDAFSTRQIMELCSDVLQVYHAQLTDVKQLGKAAEKLRKSAQEFRLLFAYDAERGNWREKMNLPTFSQAFSALKVELDFLYQVIKICISRNEAIDNCFERLVNIQSKFDLMANVNRDGMSFWYETTRKHVVLHLTPLSIAENYSGRVIFEGDSTDYQNSLGSYKIDGDGNLYDVAMHFSNASLQGSGGSLIGGVSDSSLSMTAGDKLGFFIVSDGYSYNGGYSGVDFSAGSLEFRNDDGSSATSSSINPDLWYVHTDGSEQELVNHKYHTSAGVEELYYNLNADNILHIKAVLNANKGTVSFGFEDTYNAGDLDFDDSVFTVEIGASNATSIAPVSTATPGVVYSDDDILYGGNGNDELYGKAGDDLHYGQDGVDEIYAGSGDDTAYGGSGDDLLNGGSGEDVLHGDNGNDELYGKAGDDVHYGQDGDDEIDAGSGDDTAYGGNGDDILKGGDGEDTLYGDSGSDTIYGGFGDDLIEGGGSDDLLYGNDGDDNLDGGSGQDTFYAGSGNDTVTAGGGSDTVYGNSGDDVISGEGGNDIINAGTGDDTVYGGTGDDTIKGGGDDDSLYGENGSDSIYGGFGDDTITGGSSDDTLYGNDGDDNLDGGSGHDTLYAGAGDDTVTAGSGSDTIYGDAGNDVISGESGNDVINAGAGEDQVSGGHGSDTIRGNTGDDILAGNNGHDSIFGDSGDDTIDGGAGADTLSGGSGDDIFISGSGRDDVNGGSGSDTIDYSNLTQSIRVDIHGKQATGGDSDTLYSVENAIGTDFDDWFRGDKRDNTIESGAGDDYIRGLTGDDTLTGGSGEDTFFWRSTDVGTYLDTITDFSIGDDLLQFNISSTLNLENIDDWFSLTENNGDTSLFIDLDGSGSSYASTEFALLSDVTGYSIDDFSVVV